MTLPALQEGGSNAQGHRVECHEREDPWSPKGGAVMHLSQLGFSCACLGALQGFQSTVLGLASQQELLPECRFQEDACSSRTRGLCREADVLFQAGLFSRWQDSKVLIDLEFGARCCWVRAYRLCGLGQETSPEKIG